MKKSLKTLLDKDHIKQTLLDTAFILFLLSLLHKLVSQTIAEYGQQSWQLSEFLINYQGGFVRRGFIGEVLLFFAKNFNIDVEWTIKAISLISLFAVSSFFVKAFLKRDYSLYILPLCFFLGCGLFNNWWIRKDYIFFCSFIPILWIYSKANLPIILKFLLINVLAVIVILSHEVFTFIVLPILFLLLFNDYKAKGKITSALISFVFLLPIISAFLLTLRFKGSPEIAKAIWDSWSMFFPDEASLNFGNAVNALAWSAKNTFACHIIHNFLYTDQGIFSSVVWFITLPTVYYIATNALLVFRKNQSVFTIEDKTTLSATLIFQFFCLTPLFIMLSCDYSRLAFYWITSSFAIFLLINHLKIRAIFPSFYINFVKRLNGFMDSILTPSKTVMVFLMMIIGISSWKFMIEWTYQSTMLYNILYIVSQPLIWLKDFLFHLFNITKECN